MSNLGCIPCRANGDLWMRKALHTSNIGAITDNALPVVKFYYEYTLIHVDDIMVVSRQANQMMQGISNTYKLMKDKKKRLLYVPPHVYQGRQI